MLDQGGYDLVALLPKLLKHLLRSNGCI
jgi:hypothetical protein